MFAALLIALAPAAELPATPAVPREMPFIREPHVAGPTAVQFGTLSQPHRYSDDRMFPDIAIGALSIDGDTLYVQVTNKGRSPTRASTLVVARAQSAGARSDLAEARTGRLAPGETRWVAVKGFSMKTPSKSGPVFALGNASAVSAAARLLPSSSGMLDRSGQGCGDCSAEMGEDNNQLTLSAAAIKHGRPN
jgi:hypothetical protein